MSNGDNSYIKIPLKNGIQLDSGHILEGGKKEHKFGRNLAVGTSFVPVAHGSIYRTPQVSSATQVRIKAGNANDTAAGTGAREVYIEGLDANGLIVHETIATAGTSASSNSTYSYIRIYRAYVTSSGTYASATAGSHSADIVIENSAGTEDWLTIDSTGFPKGQSEVGAVSIPDGKVAILDSLFYGADDKAKIVDLVFFKREEILETAAPYTAMRASFSLVDPGNTQDRHFYNGLGPIVGPADFGVMAKIDTGTTEVSVDFEYRLFDVK